MNQKISIPLELDLEQLRRMNNGIILPKTRLGKSLGILESLTESTGCEADYILVNCEILRLRALLLLAYKDIVQTRESGDAGFWDETELEKSIKKHLRIK